MIQLIALAHLLVAQLSAPDVQASEISQIEETLGQVDGILIKNKISVFEYARLWADYENISFPKFADLISCESKWNPEALGDYRSETDTFMARGILQFWPKTYKDFSQQYGVDRKYPDAYGEIKLASMMLHDGLWKHWYNCGKYAGLNE